MSEQLEQEQIEILEETFAKLADNGDKLVERFYMELFKRYPEVKPMFEGVDQKEQEKKLLASLALVVNNIRKPEVLGPALTKLGKNHQKYGAVAEHYTAVAETMLDVMGELAGELWTVEVKQAWTNALNTVAKAMLEAYEDSEDKTMSNDDVDELKKELQKMQVAVEGAQTAMIMVDRDFKVTYINKRTQEMLKEHRDVFASVWPGFDPDNIMGACIDMFHKNPAHQRQLLSDPNNLPYETDIEIGDLKFSLTVSAQIDPDGNYIGNTLEWLDVTELRKKENDQARLQVAVDGCQSPMIMIDRDFMITYANDATIQLLTKYQDKFKEVWPSFNINGLIGTCIDVFHKNPAHQRQLLSNPINLPYKTDIEVN